MNSIAIYKLIQKTVMEITILLGGKIAYGLVCNINGMTKPIRMIKNSFFCVSRVIFYFVTPARHLPG